MTELLILTHHTRAVLARVSSRDPSSVRVVLPVHATAWPHIHTGFEA